jgi:hypothetical protein
MDSPPRSVRSITTPRENEVSSTTGSKALSNHSGRINTYLPQELFKLVLIAPTKEIAEQEASWLTGAPNQIRGIYMCNHLKTKLAIFCRWPGMPTKQTSTVAVEALIVYARDVDDWNVVKKETMKFNSIPVRSSTRIKSNINR